MRFGLGEEFGLKPGRSVTGKMAAALRRLGFDKIFDVDFSADLTILEEGTELIGRIKNGGKLPMITSCSPGWIKYCEHFFPDFLDNLSTCKSPHQMGGAVIKSYYAEKFKIDPKSIYVVSIMPCTAKKFEKERDEMAVNGLRDVDAVLTTRELAKMIKQANLDFANLPEEDFDRVLGESTGAAVIFGATGGVMEAALRTVADILTGEDLQEVDYECVRGIDGVKEATLNIGGMDIKVAVASGTGNAKKLLEAVRAGEKEYHFIEVMGCPGGCVTGGGQPIVSARNRMDYNPYVLRAKATYAEDAGKSSANRTITKRRFYIKNILASRTATRRTCCCTHTTTRNQNINRKPAKLPVSRGFFMASVLMNHSEGRAIANNPSSTNFLVLRFLDKMIM